MKEFVAAIVILACLVLLGAFVPSSTQKLQASAEQETIEDTCRAIGAYLLGLEDGQDAAPAKAFRKASDLRSPLQHGRFIQQSASNPKPQPRCRKQQLRESDPHSHKLCAKMPCQGPPQIHPLPHPAAPTAP